MTHEHLDNRFIGYPENWFEFRNFTSKILVVVLTPEERKLLGIFGLPTWVTGL